MILVIFFTLILPTSFCLASDDVGLTQLSLEDLMNIKITSVIKKSQPLSEAAAVFVITQEDIRPRKPRVSWSAA